MNKRLVNEFLGLLGVSRESNYIYTDICSSIKDLHGDGGGEYGKVRGWP